MADPHALRLVPSGEPCPPDGTCVPVVDLTQLVGDAFMQADLLRADALALANEDAQARTTAVARMRDAAAHIEQLASLLDGDL